MWGDMLRGMLRFNAKELKRGFRHCLAGGVGLQRTQRTKSEEESVVEEEEKRLPENRLHSNAKSPKKVRDLVEEMPVHEMMG